MLASNRIESNRIELMIGDNVTLDPSRCTIALYTVQPFSHSDLGEEKRKKRTKERRGGQGRGQEGNVGARRSRGERG